MLNLCWWTGKQDLLELKATHRTTAWLYGPDSSWATPPHPSRDQLERGFIPSQTTNKLHNRQFILPLVFHWETEDIPDSALPNSILVRGLKITVDLHRDALEIQKILMPFTRKWKGNWKETELWWEAQQLRLLSSSVCSAAFRRALF